MQTTKLDMTYIDEFGNKREYDFTPTVEQTRLCLQDWDDLYHHAYQALDEVLKIYELTLEDLGLERRFFTKYDIAN